jgi:hypothetical protein
MNYNLPFELQKRTLELFAEEIIPVFARRERDALALEAAQ